VAKTFVNLRSRRRQNFELLGVCALLIFLIYGVFSTATAANVGELESLLRSHYLYSAVAPSEVGQDDYYQFDAGIGFTFSERDDTGLNADILMQPDKELYTRAVYWNAKTLSDRGIAISKNLARKNGLDIGDKLYSEHIVNGKVSEYVIEQIIPSVNGARISTRRNYTDGLIIMGYDSRYVDSISHSTVFFTNQTIEDITATIGYTPENIEYRDDEIWSVVKEIIPLFVFAITLTILISSYEIIRLVNNIRTDFKRMISMGYEEEKLDRSLTRYTHGSAVIVIAASTIISVLFSLIQKHGLIDGCVLIIMIVLECIVSLIASSIQKKRLWRA